MREHTFSSSLWRFLRYGGRVPGQVSLIDRAEDKVVVDCMNRHGFYFATQPELTASLGDDGLSSTPGPGATAESAALTYAHRYGFGIYERIAAVAQGPSPAMRRLDSYTTHLSARKYAAMTLAQVGNQTNRVRVNFPAGAGYDLVPTGGCTGQAARKVYGSVSRNDLRLNAVVAINHTLSERAHGSTAVSATEPRYARCMERRAGHAFENQAATVRWLGLHYKAPSTWSSAKALELKYAVDSTRCMYTSGGARAYAMAYWIAARRMPDSWYLVLTQVRQMDAVATRKARAILRR